jgi:hypothetical protein
MECWLVRHGEPTWDLDLNDPSHLAAATAGTATP